MHFCITSFNYNLQFTTHRARSSCDSIKKCRRPFPIALAKTVGAHKKMSAPLLQCMSKSPLLHCMSKSPLLQLTMHVEIHLQKCMSKSHWYNACRNPPAKMHVEIPLATMHVEIPLLQCMSKSLFCTSTYLCSAQVCTCAAHKYILPAFFAQVHTCAANKYELVLRTRTYCQLFFCTNAYCQLFFCTRPYVCIAQVCTCAAHKYILPAVFVFCTSTYLCSAQIRMEQNPRRPPKGNSMHTMFKSSKTTEG